MRDDIRNRIQKPAETRGPEKGTDGGAWRSGDFARQCEAGMGKSVATDEKKGDRKAEEGSK